MKSLMIVTFAAAAAVVSGPALAAKDLLDLPKSAQGETVGTAAGKAKPFTARADMICNMSSCSADFGKKNGKVRTIEWVTCGISTSGGILRVAAPILTDTNGPVGYMDVTSRALDGADETAVFTFTKPFQVPAGEKLLVFADTTGTADGGQCTLAGTIE
jgi:hypothetical protein